MKNWIALVLAATLALWQLPSQAQARVYNQAELDALLAPVALYPDAVLSNILVAASYPEDLKQAVAWTRANPQLTGENAVRAAEPIPWHPSVKALLAFPELLARMDESAQWTADLGMAFREQEPYVMDTVQGLRRRAQASGSLQSNDQYSVQQEGSSIAVYPAQPQVVYVPYYDPYVVYGPWWWPAYRPVFWRPWYAHPTVFVSNSVFFVRTVNWQQRHIVRHAAFHHHPVPGTQVRPVPGQLRPVPGQIPPVPGQIRPVPPLQGHPPSQPGQTAQHWSDQQQARWREQQQRSGSEQQQRWREQPRTDARAPRMNPPAPPVPSTNQPRAAHPFIDSGRGVIGTGRAMVESVRQPRFEQRSQFRQSGQSGPRAGHAPQQQRRQASQPQQRG